MPGRLDEPDRMVNRAAYLTLRPIPSLLQAYSRFYNRREQWSNVQQEHSNSTLWFLMSSSVPDKESTWMHRKWRISALRAWRSGLALE